MAIAARAGTAWAALGLALNLTLSSTSGRAADAAYPARPVRWIVPFSPGATDVQARAVAEKVQARLGQPIIIETKPGASTIIGTEYVVNAAPDGYTMLFTSGVITTLKILTRDLRFDPDSALAPVSLIAQGFFAVAVNASVPAKTFPEFVAYARANPGKLNYVSLGRNSVMLMVEMLKQRAGFEATPVPFQGMAPGRMAILRNDVQLILDGPQDLRQLADTGQVRLLMLAGPKRSAVLPDLPASAEAGLPGYSAGYLLALLTPRGTPAEAISRMSADVAASVNTPELQKFFLATGGEAVGSTPEALKQRLQGDSERYAEAARAARIQPE